MSVEAPIRITTSSARTPSSVRLISPVIRPSAGGRRIESFSFKSFTPEAKPQTAVKVFNIPATPKPNPISQMSKLESAKSPFLDQRISQTETFGPDSKILWQAPNQSEAIGSGQAQKLSVYTFKVDQNLRNQTEAKAQTSPRSQVESNRETKKPNNKLSTSSTETQKLQQAIKELQKNQPKVPELTTPAAQVDKATAEAAKAVQEVTKEVGKLSPELHKVVKVFIRVQSLTENSFGKEVKKPQLLALKTEFRELKLAVTQLQQVEQGKPQPETKPEKIQGQGDLEQSVRTYQQLKAGLKETGLEPQQCQQLAQEMVEQALKPNLKDIFQQLVKENPDITPEMVEKKLMYREREEEEIIEIVAERDPKADAAKEREFVEVAKEVLNSRENQDRPIAGAKIVAKISQPDPQEEKSEIVKGKNILDGSRQLALAFIASSTVCSIEEARWLIKKAIKLFPAVRFRTRITTERVAQEDVENVLHGESYYQKLRNSLKAFV